ncbi:hypothetical protein RB195_017333 [Necator americanus]|uniref:BPTI/Kunitz inhibitor domain-containing protein n=1 Tax=Necator americanus TaxID=51031 RepID=A0ABR1C7V4_NECAM
MQTNNMSVDLPKYVKNLLAPNYYQHTSMMQSVIAIVLFAATASAIPSRCYEGIVTGPCRAMHERYAYDPAKGECVRFNYGGCAGNNNNFMSKLECQLVCKEQDSTFPEHNDFIIPGLIRRPTVIMTMAPIRLPKYSMEIEPNLNVPSSSGRPTACGLPIETGMCFASLRRYAFDDTRGRCVSFIYGGCGGNENNFETLEDCEYACLNTITSR